MPSVSEPLAGILAEKVGFKVVYTGGYATGGSHAITEPLLTMTEQVEHAGKIDRSCSVP